MIQQQMFPSTKRPVRWRSQILRYQAQRSIAVSPNTREQINFGKQIPVPQQMNEDYFEREADRISRRVNRLHQQIADMKKYSKQQQQEKNRCREQLVGKQAELRKLHKQERKIRQQITNLVEGSIQHEQLLDQLEDLKIVIRQKEIEFEGPRKKADTVIKTWNVNREWIAEFSEILQHQYKMHSKAEKSLTFGALGRERRQ